MIGGVVGTIVGAFPGLSAPTAIALLLPLTFALTRPPRSSCSPASITARSIGGTITSVLVSVPGEIRPPS